MTVRRLTVDWDELELAFTWHEEEGGCWLDLTTGEVVRWMGPADDMVSSDDIDDGLAEGRLVPIEPVASEQGFEWMAGFADSVVGSLQGPLQKALSGPRPFRQFKDVLLDSPEDRERWFAFHSERVREHARRWLEEHDIEPTNEPPTRSRS